MNLVANDLRILKLAELYESSFERFIVDVTMRTITDEETRRDLAALLPQGHDHEARIVGAIARLNAALPTGAAGDVQRAAVMDIVEVERLARDAFRRSADRVHDPRVVRLLRELADEEDAHARIAERALARLEARQGKARLVEQADAHRSRMMS